MGISNRAVNKQTFGNDFTITEKAPTSMLNRRQNTVDINWKAGAIIIGKGLLRDCEIIATLNFKLYNRSADGSLNIYNYYPGDVYDYYAVTLDPWDAALESDR